MPRNLLSFGNDAVRDLVRVRLALAALLSFRPTSKFGVAAGGDSFCSRRGAATKPRVFAQHFVSLGRPFISTLRAFHPANLAN